MICDYDLKKKSVWPRKQLLTETKLCNIQFSPPSLVIHLDNCQPIQIFQAPKTQTHGGKAKHEHNCILGIHIP